LLELLNCSVRRRNPIGVAQETKAMRISDIAKWPLWVIQVFTTAKSFTHPIIGSRRLNRWGLHTFRMRLAQAMTQWRWLFMGHLMSPELRRNYREQGYITIENFLPPDEFTKLRDEILNFDGDLRRMKQGDTLTFQGLLDDQTACRMPAYQRLISDRRFRGIMMYGGSTFKLPMFFAHCVRNGVESGTPDPQKDFHSDTFHPTMKAWLFLDDVDESIGPFNYVPGSHRPSPQRLKWDYENSIAGGKLSNRYAQRGSLRISPENLKPLGFAEPVAMTVPANTLVMADTHGFHRRGDAEPGASRLAVYAYSRSNPFNPLPGFAPPDWRSRIEQFFTQRNLIAADLAAEKNGKRASWHKVPNAELRANAQSAAETNSIKSHEPPRSAA
jgi:hypothetical protein